MQIQLDQLPLGLWALFSITVVSVAAMIRMNAIIKFQKKQIEEMKSTKAPSEELTEFLSDVKNNGYGFVRVDPGNVFWRKP